MEAATSSSSAAANKPERVALDQRATTYRNENWGFSFTMPTYLVSAGGCDVMPYPEGGYRMKVLEDNDTIYITPAVYGRNTMVSEKPDGSGVYECTVIEAINVDQLRPDFVEENWFYHGWMMKAARVENEAAMLAFLKGFYGEGCEIRSKSPTQDGSAWNVELDTSWDMEREETARCPVNGLYAVKYSPEKKTVVTWRIGPDGRFDDLDMQMTESFRFE